LLIQNQIERSLVFQSTISNVFARHCQFPSAHVIVDR
jgi:hypothetical protein